jgi:hypothetical protein
MPKELHVRDPERPRSVPLLGFTDSGERFRLIARSLVPMLPLVTTT